MARNRSPGPDDARGIIIRLARTLAAAESPNELCARLHDFWRQMDDVGSHALNIFTRRRWARIRQAIDEWKQNGDFWSPNNAELHDRAAEIAKEIASLARALPGDRGDAHS